jgi:hypothetical protein
MQAEIAPPEPLMRLGRQRPAEGGRQDQRPGLALAPHARDRHRIGQREGAAVARRAHVHPGQVARLGEKPQVGAQLPRLGQEGDHRDRLAERQKRQDRLFPVPRDPFTHEPRQHRYRNGGARGMAHHQHLVQIVVHECHRDARGEILLARGQLGRRGTAVARAEGVVLHEIMGEEASVDPPEALQHRRRKRKPHPPAEDRPAQPTDEAPHQPADRHCKRQLDQEHHDRIGGRDHRPPPSQTSRRSVPVDR